MLTATIPIAGLVLLLAAVAYLARQIGDSGVQFRGRDYIDCDTRSRALVELQFGRLLAIGDEAEGRAVLLPRGQLPVDSDPTVLFLENADESIDVCGLSGGP